MDKYYNSIVKYLFDKDIYGVGVITVKESGIDKENLVDFFDEDIWYLENKMKEFLSRLKTKL